MNRTNSIIRLGLLLMAVLLPVVSVADSISARQAREFASSVLGSAELVFHSGMLDNSSSGQQIRLAAADDASEGFYVFSANSGRGFVIVSGSDKTARILGYSPDHSFPKDLSDAPDNLKQWLEYMKDEVAFAESSDAAELVLNWAVTEGVGNPVVNLETALWDQGAPYNYLCPKTTEGNFTYTGCNATALAIVMRYHRWPERGTGTLPGYLSDNLRGDGTGTVIDVPDIPLGHAYDWDNMLLDYSKGYSDAQRDAVATLMRDCAIMLESYFGEYNVQSTGAGITNSVKTLPVYMGYDNMVHYIFKEDYNWEEWTAMMKAELDAGRPVLYSGMLRENGVGNPLAGHVYVLHGYTDKDYFNINWGWGGSANGYFLLDAMAPYDDNYIYSSRHEIVAGVMPDAGYDYYEELRFVERNIGCGLMLDGEVVPGVPFNLRTGVILNNMGSEFVGEIILAVTDQLGNIRQEIARTRFIEADPMSLFYWDLSDVVINFPFEDGFRIRALYTSKKSPGWNVVRGNDDEGCVWDLLLADEYTGGEDYPDRLIFVPNSTTSGSCGLIADSQVASGQPFRLELGRLLNNGYVDFNGRICVAVLDQDDNIVQTLYEWDCSGINSLKPGAWIQEQLSCTITDRIGSGYHIQTLYRSDKTPEWTPIQGAGLGECTWDIALTEEEDPSADLETAMAYILSTTSLRYDKTSGEIILNKAAEVSVTITDASGSPVEGLMPDIDSDADPGNALQFTGNVADMPSGPCRVVLTYGVGTIEFTITFKSEDNE